MGEGRNRKEASGSLRRQCRLTAFEEDDPELFLLALRNVAEAQGAAAVLAEKTKLNHDSLYRMLSELGNPEFRSLDALLQSLGFWLAVAMNR